MSRHKNYFCIFNHYQQFPENQTSALDNVEFPVEIYSTELINDYFVTFPVSYSDIDTVEDRIGSGESLFMDSQIQERG